MGRLKNIYICATCLSIVLVCYWLTVWFIKPNDVVGVGDSKELVLKKMGSPAQIFENDFVALKYGGEVWAYGEAVDLKAAARGVYPLKFRFITPNPGDLLVVFDASGRVAALRVYQ